jgi:hypothetical protein
LARLVKILVDTYIDPAIGRSVKIAGMDGDFREDSEELRKAFVRADKKNPTLLLSECFGMTTEAPCIFGIVGFRRMCMWHL